LNQLWRSSPNIEVAEMSSRESRPKLAERIRAVRLDLYGESGGPLLAKQMKVPFRVWMRYDAGEMMPAEILLRFITLTNVNPQWLLKGRDGLYRGGRPPDMPKGPAAEQPR
jgi:hypothetical protein